MLEVQFIRLSEQAIAPKYAHDSDAGADLSCLEAVELKPGERKLIGTGLAIELPPGHVGLIHPRSGLANKHGISIVNAPGTIDPDYRGEIFINLINLDKTEIFYAPAGTRIAQLVIQQFVKVNFAEKSELSATVRGQAGHGSTGVAGL